MNSCRMSVDDREFMDNEQIRYGNLGMGIEGEGIGELEGGARFIQATRSAYPPQYQYYS